MNQNISVDNDLQKAIDDITKSTAGDPLFSDPVAAPAPAAPFPGGVPGPMPAPTPMPTQAPIAAPAPAPISMNAPLNTPIAAPMPMPEPVKPAEPVSAPIEDIKPAPIVHEDEPEEVIAEVASVETAEAPAENKAPFVESGNLSINEVKEAALRELAPILDKLDVPAEQKFDIYKDVIDNYHDSSVIAPAYHAASDIADDRERGEALLYIIDSIDKM